MVGGWPRGGNNLDLVAEPVSVPAPRVVTAIALIVASLLLVACSHTVAGSATADPAAVARVAQERACRSAGDAIVTAIRTMVQRVDSGGFLDGPTALREVLGDMGERAARSEGFAEQDREFHRLLFADVHGSFGRSATEASAD